MSSEPYGQLANFYDLNVKCKTIKCLEENIGEKLCDLKLGEEFLDMAPKAQPMKGETKLFRLH